MPSTSERPAQPRAKLLMVLILGVVAGAAIDRCVLFGVPALDPPPDFRLISQAWGIIHRYYVDRGAEQPTALTYGAISGMVNALGDTGHTRFLTPQMVNVMKELERSSFQGIGAQIQLKGGRVVIVTPMDDSPAQRAGIKPGDAILQVNGQSVTGDSLEQVERLVAGPAGTDVTLTILEVASSHTRQVKLTRATIIIHNVTWRMLPGTSLADLRVAAFEKGVTDDLRQALIGIKKESASGLILDLRNNPGGLLDEAIGAADQFLNRGNVLVVKNADGQERPIPSRAGGEGTSIRLVTLVNGGTASGAEIMAGALQDSQRSRLVGETTFGTGTVLTQFRLSDGSALLLAIEEWLTPAGHVIWHKGITPDVMVAMPTGASPLAPSAIRSMDAAQLRNSHDAQLLEALRLLQEPQSTLQQASASALPGDERATATSAAPRQ